MFISGTDQGVVTLGESLEDPVKPGQLFRGSAYPFCGLRSVAFLWLHGSAHGKLTLGDWSLFIRGLGISQDTITQIRKWQTKISLGIFLKPLRDQFMLRELDLIQHLVRHS
jgi:hypothetical protein